MNDCIFCKIVNNELPCYKVYEDDLVLAFLTIEPDTNGHTLIIPKEHFVDIYDISDKMVLYIHKIKKEIANLLTDKLCCDGIRFSQNNGSAQEVKHFHMHVIPQYIKKQNIINVEDIYKKIKI